MKGCILIFLFFNRIVSVFLLPVLQVDLPPGVNVEHEALLHLGITDSVVDWRNAFGRLAERYKNVNNQLIKATEIDWKCAYQRWKNAYEHLAERYKNVTNQLIKANEDLRKEGLIESIRSKIEFWEDMLAPDYKSIGKQNDNTAYVNLHKERWVWIIQNSRDPIVKKMKEFIKNNLNNDHDSFCTRIAAFFTYNPRLEHIPPLHEYNVEEVDKITPTKFIINDDTTLKVVHFFMKT